MSHGERPATKLGEKPSGNPAAEPTAPLAEKPLEAPRLPRMERHISGYYEHFPLVERVQAPKPYAALDVATLRVAARVLDTCAKARTYTTLTLAEVTELGLEAASALPPGPQKLARDVRIAELVAALGRATGVEWAAVLAADAADGLHYAFVRGERDEIAPLEVLKAPLAFVGTVAHNHPSGTLEPSFGDLQGMSSMRQVAGKRGFIKPVDDIIVANLREHPEGAFELVRYEHTFEPPP